MRRTPPPVAADFLLRPDSRPEDQASRERLARQWGTAFQHDGGLRQARIRSATAEDVQLGWTWIRREYPPVNRPLDPTLTEWPDGLAKWFRANPAETPCLEVVLENRIHVHCWVWALDDLECSMSPAQFKSRADILAALTFIARLSLALRKAIDVLEDGDPARSRSFGSFDPVRRLFSRTTLLASDNCGLGESYPNPADS